MGRAITGLKCRVMKSMVELLKTMLENHKPMVKVVFKDTSEVQT